MSATIPPASRSHPLALDDLILLNDEIRGLIAAGVPLDVGLSGFAGRVGGRLKAFTERLSQRIAAGMPLDQALELETGSLPAEYRVVLAAGLRCGRFDLALASMTRYAASLRDLRAGLRRALIYPGVICGLAFGLLAGIFWYVVPLLLTNIDSLRLRQSTAYTVLETLHRTVVWWGIGIPAAIFLLVELTQVVQWLRWRFGDDVSTAQVSLGAWRWIPGLGGALRAAHWSRFAHLLAVLVEAGVPFIEATRLSAGAVGDARIVDAIERTGRRVSGGQALAEALDRRSGVPPVLRWLMLWGERESTLAPALREAAAQYEQRALLRAELVQRIVPFVVVVLIGGGLTAIYALTIFVPLTSIWSDLATNG
jgi:type II secretory pathway component PulF